MFITVVAIMFGALVLAGLTWASIRGGAMTVSFVALISVIALGIFYWVSAQSSPALSVGGASFTSRQFVG